MNQKHSLLNSFRYAAGGIVYAVKHERNMRIHIVAAAYVLFFSRFYNLDKIRLLIIGAVITLVISLELINTAIEKSADITAPGYHPLAGTAKDVAAGAVLISAVFSVFAGFIIFYDMVIIRRILSTLFLNPVNAALTVLSVIISVFFIRGAHPEN